MHQNSNISVTKKLFTTIVLAILAAAVVIALAFSQHARYRGWQDRKAAAVRALNHYDALASQTRELALRPASSSAESHAQLAELDEMNRAGEGVRELKRKLIAHLLAKPFFALTAEEESLLAQLRAEVGDRPQNNDERAAQERSFASLQNLSPNK